MYIYIYIIYIKTNANFKCVTSNFKYMNKKTHTIYRNHKHFSSFQKLCHLCHIDKAYEKERNICGFNKLCVF